MNTGAAAWRAYAASLSGLAEPFEALAPADWSEQDWQELYRQLHSGLAMGHLAMYLGDAEHPAFWPVVHQAYNYLVPNPDSTYFVAPLADDGCYRISGFRGSVRTVDVQIGSGTFFTKGDAPPGPNLASHDLDELKIADDGAFDVVLSTERPAGHTGDWWKLDTGATYVLARQTAYDWLREVDARLAIERLDRPAARPRPSAACLAERLRGIPVWAQTWTMVGAKWAASYREKGMINQVFVRGLQDVGGVGDQHYIEGQFALGPDEALIYETELPQRCHYWNVQLTDMLWGALDFVHGHTSVNGHTAHLDADGKFRAVIAARDPGVPNWLDTLGYSAGTILGRWTRASDAPVPTLRKVRFDEVRGHLPAETPTVTPEQRDADLRRRRQGVQLRHRW